VDAERNDALRSGDTAALSRLYADDFLMITSTGELRSKRDQLRDIGSGTIQHQGPAERVLHVTIEGDVAVLQGESDPGTLITAGRPDARMRRYTRVYVHRSGRWQLLATQISVVADGSIASAAQVQPPDTVVVPSGNLRLKGLLWQPKGNGPFPAVFFNHGSWPTNNRSGRPAREIFEQAAALGPVFSRHGFVFLFLFRRGAGLSANQGVNGADLLDKEFAAKGQDARNDLQLKLLETDELTEAEAGLSLLRKLRTVDPKHIAIAGHSFGGSLTLLLAERDADLMAAVDFAGGAASWDASPQLRARLLKAVAAAPEPIFFIHAVNDYSTAPGKALAAERERLGKPYRIKIYPAFGTSTSDGHNLVDLSDCLSASFHD
jgi:dienelactone hydrolase/ketosteroid isomerase-like protein